MKISLPLLLFFTQKAVLLFAGSFITFTFLLACNSIKTTTKKPEPVIATVGGEPLYLAEFQYAYEKSMGTDYSRQKVEQYLELYINFKLKIIEAEKLGLDQQPGFQKELDSYKEQLAKPYLTDKEKVDELVREAYDRLKEEVNVSHILIRISEDAEPEDTLLAYNQIRDIRQQALDGKSFENLAFNYSQDVQTREKAGNLGYFTALQMVYNFEDMSYKTAIGDISDLLRTRFGYHIIRVEDKRSASGKLLTAHIMVYVPKNASPQDSLQAKRKIEEIYQQLQQGEDWDKLCSQFSDDIDSKNNGGKLPAFGIGTVIPAFEQAAFSLENPGDISTPILTDYGWHIIKLIEKQELLSFEELEPYLHQKVSQDSRYEITRQSMLVKLQTMNSLVQNPKNLEVALAQADELLLKGEWDFSPTAPFLRNELFSFTNKALAVKKIYTIDDFFQYVYQRQVPKPELRTPSHYMKILYEEYVEKCTFDFERGLLEQKYPEYRMLVKEYKEGMLLFQMMNEKVWNKALIDTVGARQFYEQNIENYQWESRAEVLVFDCADNMVLQQVQELLATGLYPQPQLKTPTIYFAQDVTTLSNNSLQNLAPVVKEMQQNPFLILEVIGHADPAETPDLADSRAKKLREYLQTQGIDIARVIIKSFGNTKPISKTDRSQNRRTELKFYSVAFSALENIINRDNPLNLRITQGNFEKGKNPMLAEIEWKEGKYDFPYQDRVMLVEVQKITPATHKTFEEAKGIIITDYQSFLEKEWLSSLRQKYPVDVNKQTIEALLAEKE